MFFRLDDGSYLNLARIHRVVFDDTVTKLYFSQMAHDFLKLKGDRVEDIINAATAKRR